MSKKETRVLRSSTRNKKRKQENDVLEALEEKGLVLSKDKKYIKIDNTLMEQLQRLQELQEVPMKNINPFKEYANFISTISQGTPLTVEFLERCSETRKESPNSLKMAEMIANFPLDWLALKRSKMVENDWDYSVKLPINPKVTDQGNSGRCWAYSALNAMRIPLMRKFNLEHRFEFSEAYLFFYDKIERSNMFFEYMWTFRDRPLEDRDIRKFTSPSSHFTSDGGFFTYFVNLISKYGIVPKNIYDECFNSMVSYHLNDTLVNVLNHMALEVFRNKDNWSREDFDEYKEKCNITIYDLVVKFLGEPPKPNTRFTWVYRDEEGRKYSIPNLTPEKFYRTVIPHEHDTKITIINDPRHEETYYMSSWSPYSVNIQGGVPITMINLPMDEFKQIICESLKNEDPVWFASDISRCLDRECNTSDTNRFDFSSVLGTNTEFTKADMLDMHTAVPNHALIFIGVDTVEDAEGNVTSYKKWRVENSWGSDLSIEDDPDNGYYRMMDDYVDKYVFEAVVDLKYFPTEITEKIMENTQKGNSFTYDPYDVFGALSMKENCSHCQKNNYLKRPTFK